MHALNLIILLNHFTLTCRSLYVFSRSRLKRNNKKALTKVFMFLKYVCKTFHCYRKKLKNSRKHNLYNFTSFMLFQKRNAAQLLRMKKQIKETQLRNRAWNSQIQQLKQNIAMLNDKIQTAEQ